MTIETCPHHLREELFSIKNRIGINTATTVPSSSSMETVQSENYATADRPRCMIRDEIYLNQQQPKQYQKDNRRHFRYDDGGKHDVWNWNMSHLEYDHVVSSSSSISNAKKSQKSSKSKNGYVPSSRSTTSSSTSSFQSFFRWFRRDHKKSSRHRINDISYPKDITYLNDDVFETDDDEYAARYSRNSRNKTQKVKQTADYPPSSSQRFSNEYYPSSSCDSVFSTASSFAFVPPVKYLKNRNQKQPVKQQSQQQQPQIDDRSYTESYQKRVKARDQAVERDKREEITLRRKYHLYDESSDIETLNDSLRTRNFDLHESNRLQSASRSTNFSDSEKLQDLNSRQHRRANSDIIESKKTSSSASYLHVKGKRKAPSPPKSRTNPRTLSPKTSLGRKKRPAPLPPVLKLHIEEESATTSSTSLLEDKDIKALIEGNFSKKDFSSTPTLTAADMERRPAYVSPYLKIRENRKLTDEQKRILIEQVSTSNKKREEDSSSTESTPKKNDQIFTIQEGQLIYQGNESPKLPPQSEEKLVAPPSPISPRPWFKRNPNSTVNHQQKDVNQNQSIFRTLEKKIHKNEEKEKDLPEYGYSRNSFFGNRFNIFAKLAGDESNKKKEKEQEKRRSQIGIPNISELDREAAEIIQIGQELKKDVSEIMLMRTQGNSLLKEEFKAKTENEKLKSTKELIDKFESDASQFNPRVIAVNNASIVARKEFFGENMEIPTPLTIEEINTKDEKVPKKSSPPKDDVKSSPMLESRKSKLPHLVNGIRKQDDLMGLWICTYCTLQNPNWKIICEACEKVKPYEKKYNVNNGDVNLKTTLNWDKKTEMVLKYFQPPAARPGGLSKSASETIVNKSLSVKTSKIPGSPLLNMRRTSKTSPEKRVNEIQRIIREHELKNPSNVAKTPVINERPKSGNSHTKTPDLNALRSARLAKFNFPSHKSLDIEKVKKSSQEKFFNDRINFNDPVSLEREKERLREKIRQMNTRALAEKYPVQKPTEVESQQDKAEPSAPVLTPPTTNESSKLGAIRKVRKIEEMIQADEEKIINKNADDDKSPVKSDSECQTTLKNSAKNTKVDEKCIEPVTSEPVDINEINEISEQLQSKNGIENFKSSLLMSKTNTLAINKILRYLESAISDGNHQEAAEFAMNLAKMKVSLSVTRQRDRPKSEVEPSLQNVKVNLNIRNGVRDLVKKQLNISLLMTVSELKQKIEADYSICMENQKLFINKDLIDNGDDKFLGNYVRPDGMMDVVIYNKKPLNNTPTKNYTSPDSESDDETQNEKVGEGEIGAVGGKVEPAKVENLEKIENKGWECTLCTLINKPESSSCAACSTGRPNLNKLPATLNDIEYKLKVNEDLQKFYEFEKIELRQQSNNSKNDLNRHSANRKSSDILNILKDEKAASFADLAECSPNISKTKYRGVDNFNPNIAYAFPKQQPKLEVRKPVITNVIYKSTLSETKESIKARLNHYQELMKLDISNIAPNTEPFECSICFLEISKCAGAILRECLHTFCRPCLASHIKYADEPEVKCPYIDNHYSCQCVLQEREIRALVSKEVYDTHLAKSIRIAEHKIENTFHCKTPNCSGWCIFEDTTNIFKCPVCTIVNCLTCGAIHDGLNCKQFQDQLANNDDSDSAQETKKLLQELIEKDEAMNCPTCHIFLLKKWGCDWLKCSFCKTEICWVTRGHRWGPNGKGDTSGGCKCGVNGKKCSAKCNYCH